MNRHVVCLCGSGRFWSEILAAAAELTLKGYIVLQPNFNTKQTPPNHTTREEKERLDLLHLDKITMSDEVVIVCPGGYVGESTARELFFAKRTGKLITFTHPKEFAARIRERLLPSWRKFLKAADDFVQQNYRGHGNVGLFPTSDVLIDQWIDDCSPPVPVSLISRAQAATPAAARLAAVMNDEIGKLRAHLVTVLDLLESAWGVIANAHAPGWGGGGDPREWVTVATKWRDEFLLLIKPDHPVMLATATLRKQNALREGLQRIIDTVRSRPADCADLLRDVQVEIENLAPLLSGWFGPDEPSGARAGLPKG